MCVRFSHVHTYLGSPLGKGWRTFILGINSYLPMALRMMRL
nr:MAG TPA: hypothetical protein [Caudoviricetes sp.]